MCGGRWRTVKLVANTTGVISPAPLTVTAQTNTKTYDTNTSAAAIPVVTGLKGTDTVTGLAETYYTKNAGTGKTLTVSPGYTVNGGDSGLNYCSAAIAACAVSDGGTVRLAVDTTGVINPALLTITAQTYHKTYDATESAAAGPVVSGLLGTDTVTNLSETYDTKNAGTGKTLSVATYTVNDGNNGKNYCSAAGCLANAGGTVNLVVNNTGGITAAPLTIKAQTNTKPYDGNTSAAAEPTVTGLQGTEYGRRSE